MVGVEDLVDKAVIRTIQNGGEVFLLTAQQTQKKAGRAALFRY